MHWKTFWGWISLNYIIVHQGYKHQYYLVKTWFYVHGSYSCRLLKTYFNDFLIMNIKWIHVKYFHSYDRWKKQFNLSNSIFRKLLILCFNLRESGTTLSRTLCVSVKWRFFFSLKMSFIHKKKTLKFALTSFQHK